MKKYILAIDQGTTSSRAILFDRQGNIIRTSQEEFNQFFPHPGWVEHDADEILASVIHVVRDAVIGIDLREIAAVGMTNQRETTVVWNRHTGRPVYRAIVWQSRQSAEICEGLQKEGRASLVRSRTGLVIDAYFSGTKVKWILDHVPGARKSAEAGDLVFGTIDSWLLWHLTTEQIHATDPTNASRTMLYNIHREDWDPELLAMLDIPSAMFPVVIDSSAIAGELKQEILGASIPISGIAGDQQAALFGQNCFEEGMAKNTYGTGCFMLMNTGQRAVSSANGLLTTIAWRLGGQTTYALEGSIFVAGSAIKWLRDELGVIRDAAETEALAASLTSNEGVYFVPAFVGLGTPYWDSGARGAVLGLTRGSNRAHLVRAALEAIAYQTKDVLSAMEKDAGIRLSALKVDGGAVSNRFLMQFQSDLLGVGVARPVVQETTALGAAYLAGLAVGFWKDLDDIRANWQLDTLFSPRMQAVQRNRLYRGWKKAVKAVRTF